MSWRSIQFDWNRARAFLVTAEEGSLSAAARALGVTQPTIGRQIDALEAELEVALFVRSPRGLELTPGGLRLLEHAREMGMAASQISLSATGQSKSLDGNVSVSAAEDLAVFFLPGFARRFREIEPGIVLQIIASNSTSDLNRREADIAIRGYQPTQEDLIARRLSDVAYTLYASPEYLQTIDNPVDPSVLSHADFVGADDTEGYIAGLAQWGISATASNFVIKSANRIVQWELVKQGLGIGPFPCAVGDPEDRAVRVIADSEPMSAPIWLVAHRELRTSLRVRRVFDFLAAELTDVGWGCR